jgi:hypothetical protein
MQSAIAMKLTKDEAQPVFEGARHRRQLRVDRHSQRRTRRREITGLPLLLS